MTPTTSSGTEGASLVSSRFSIISPEVDSSILQKSFSWPITEVVKPGAEFHQHITVYDLEVGKHTNVSDHLAAVKKALLKEEEELSQLAFDCGYTLWVHYDFPAGDGAINLSPHLLAAFGFLRVAIIFQLNDLPIATSAHPVSHNG